MDPQRLANQVSSCARCAGIGDVGWSVLDGGGRHEARGLLAGTEARYLALAKRVGGGKALGA